MLKVAISFGLRLWLFHISLCVFKKHTTWSRWPSPFTVPRSVIGGCIYFHAEGRDGPAETMVATPAWEDSNTYNYDYRPGLMPIIITTIAQHHRAWSAHHLHPLIQSYLIIIDHPTVNLCTVCLHLFEPALHLALFAHKHQNHPRSPTGAKARGGRDPANPDHGIPRHLRCWDNVLKIIWTGQTYWPYFHKVWCSWFLLGVCQPWCWTGPKGATTSDGMPYVREIGLAMSL